MWVATGRRVIFIVALPLLACQPMEQDYAAFPSVDASPQTAPAEPPVEALAEAKQSLAAGDAKEALKKLSKVEPVTPLERAWHRHLLGEVWFELGAHDKARQLLLANYEELRDARPAPDPTLSRILASGLKRLGTYYREQADFDQAYTLHQLQFLYLRRFGDLQDRHEVLIDLHVDALSLRNYFASEQWLREALQVAQQMPAGGPRQKAMIVTWNSLSRSLQELLRFPEAEAATKESRRLSQVYDQKSGREDFLEVGSLAQYAEVLAAWAQYAETQNPPEAKPLHAKAQATALEALALAEQQGLGGNERIDLEQRLRKFKPNGATF